MKKPLLVIIIAIGAFLALGKGWLAFITIPFWAIASLLLWSGNTILQEISKQQHPRLLDKYVIGSIPLMYLLILVGAIGAGDTQDITTFGFIRTDNSSLVSASDTISTLALIAFVLVAAYGLIRLYGLGQSLRPPLPSSRFILPAILIGLLIIGAFSIVPGKLFPGREGRQHFCNGQKVAPHTDGSPYYCNGVLDPK